MKKILYLPLILLCFISCSKNSDNEYYVSFSANGVNKKYTGHTFFHIEVSGTDKELQMVGATSAMSFDDYLGIYINNYPGSGNITTGEYTDLSTSFTVLATYENGGVAYEAGETLAQDAASAGVTINHFKVNITQINDETIRGTFSGDFYDEADVTKSKVTITNGEFFVKYQ